MIKTVLIQHRAYHVGESQQGLENILSMCGHAASYNPDLVVLPEACYPGYYLGLLNDPIKAVAGWKTALKEFCSMAQKHRFNLVAGLAELDGNHIYNSAFLINRQGDVIGKARKTFLWHFDKEWFSPGNEYGVFQTDIGKIGMIICADGRMPEISRMLGLKGADIIVDSTNWVTTGSDKGVMSNPQFDYMVRARAIENGTWFLCANKTGQEADTVMYCGRSAIISPEGKVVVSASPDKEELVFGMIDGKGTGPLQHKDRSLTEKYRTLTLPNNQVPLADVLTQPIVPQKSSALIGCVQSEQGLTPIDMFSSSATVIQHLVRQHADLIVMPDFPELPHDILSRFRDFAGRYRTHIALGLGETTLLFSAQGHEPHIVTGKETEVVYIGDLGVGFIRNQDGFIPEEARCLFLQGADVICWHMGTSNGKEIIMARTRATENRTYLASACTWSSNNPLSTSMIVSPDGSIIAQTLPMKTQGVLAQVSPALSRLKRLTHGTDVFLDRLPHLYSQVYV